MLFHCNRPNVPKYASTEETRMDKVFMAGQCLYVKTMMVPYNTRICNDYKRVHTTFTIIAYKAF